MREIRNDADATIVAFNPKEYKAVLVCFDGVAKNADLSFNVNFFDQKSKNPIGLFSMGRFEWKGRLPSKGRRPTMAFSNVIVEAGPELLNGGELCLAASMLDGQYQGDVVRKAHHNAIGWNADNEVVVGFFKNASMGTVIRGMRDVGCTYAMNCDGGGSAFLQYGNVRRGTALYCGVQLFFKK